MSGKKGSLGHMANTNNDLPSKLPHTKDGKTGAKPAGFDPNTLPRKSVNRR